MKKRTFISMSVAVVAAIMLTSCMDSEQKIILNPDGSGKAQIIVQMQPMPTGGLGFGNPDAPKPDPDEVARETAAGLLAGAEGVDAWKDVEWGVTDEGLSEFKGVAYFPDLTRFGVGSMKSGNMSVSGGEANWMLEDQGDGTLALTYKPMGSEEEAPAAAAEPDSTPTPEEIEQQIKQQRMQFQQMKGMMAPLMAGLKSSVSIKLPGEIQSANIFEKSGPNVAKMSFSGTQMLEGMEKMMMDDELMKRLASEGQLGEGMQGEPPPEVMETMFGGEGPVRLVFEAGSPQFDYQAEMQAAKASLPSEVQEMIESAGEETGGGFGSAAPMAKLGDGDFASAVKAWQEGLSSTFETDSGKTIEAEILEVGNAKEEDNSGSAEVKLKLTDGEASETLTITVSFSKSDEGWRANGFSGGALPDFLGEGLEPLSAVGDWVRGE